MNRIEFFKKAARAFSYDLGLFILLKAATAILRKSNCVSAVMFSIETRTFACQGSSVLAAWFHRGFSIALDLLYLARVLKTWRGNGGDPSILTLRCHSYYLVVHMNSSFLDLKIFGNVMNGESTRLSHYPHADFTSMVPFSRNLSSRGNDRLYLLFLIIYSW